MATPQDRQKLRFVKYAGRRFDIRRQAFRTKPTGEENPSSSNGDKP